MEQITKLLKEWFKLILNPSLLFSYIKKWITEYKNKEKKLKIGLYSRIQDCNFGLNNYLGMGCSLYASRIGDFSYIGSNSTISKTTIGKFCSIGMNVQIGLGSHPTHFVSTHPAFYANNKDFMTFADKMYFSEYADVVIENDVWIGNNVIVIGKVKIGNGSIISAGSIVTKDVQPYSIVAGVPAKHIKFRFQEHQILFLLEFKWWDKETEWLKEHYKYFHSIDILMNSLPNDH